MAHEYPGNIIPAPGFWKGNDSSDEELLASYARFTQKGVTFAPGQGVIDIGQIIAQRESDKLWVKYNNSGGDGAGVARGVNRRGVDTGLDPEGHKYQGNVVISGVCKLHLIKGLDSAAANDLGARSDTALNMLIL